MTEEKNRYPCPCCGFLTMSYDSHFSFEICPVCNWEDDDIQFYNPGFRGGANSQSLNEARINFKKIGASDIKYSKMVRDPLPEEIPKI